MTTLVFQHGWCFDAEFFRPLAELLPAVRAIHLDSGYFGPARGLPEQVHAAVGVGHSRGFGCLLGMTEVRWQALVGIGAFTRFAQSEEQHVALAAMIAAYEREPQRVLKAFRHRTRAAGPTAEELERERLGADLKDLAAFDCRKELERARCPVLALHAADDAIVPLERAQRDFAGHVFRQRDDGGHGLGFNKRHWCVQAIADFLKAHALC